LRAVIEHYTDVQVLGAVHHDARLQITERHLGLMPSNESPEALHHIKEIGQVVGSQVDLDALIVIANSAPAQESALVNIDVSPRSIVPVEPKLRIGVARDQAFGFYYADDLQAIREAGAEIVNIDTLHDKKLPADLDGLFIGGGFPELFMEQLEQNAVLRKQVRDAIESGLPTYAECGGLMYLARSLSWQGKNRKMAGVIPGDVIMHGKPVGRGYVRVRSTGQCKWPGEEVGRELLAHEFHYSSLENVGADLKYAFEVQRGHGIDGKRDGIVYKNLLACYTHFRSLHGYNWAERFVGFVREVKTRGGT
jgi:cobyrinic acid a,c-diamide synthase